MTIFQKLVRRAFALRQNPTHFENSEDYWEQRYRRGGSSGAGSYGRLAEFKAEVLNGFVADHAVETVVELGCGDGNQLKLASYPAYVGVDISETAVNRCRTLFQSDNGKTFVQAVPSDQKFDLALSLDVIYHLVEDDIFERYMTELFAAANYWVCIFASNLTSEQFSTTFSQTPLHVRHRRFTDWVEKNRPDWILDKVIPNRFPYDPNNPKDTSFADFHFFRRHHDFELISVSQ